MVRRGEIRGTRVSTVAALNMSLSAFGHVSAGGLLCELLDLAVAASLWWMEALDLIDRFPNRGNSAEGRER